MSRLITPRNVFVAAVTIILLVVPVYAAFTGNTFMMTLFTRIVILAIAAVSLNLIMGFGGMVSFRLAGGEAAALEVCRSTTVFTLGESLGGVESLIEHPGRMTHASVAGSQLEVPDDLVRLSVGIETADDLLADLERALGRLAA